jgi:hypothetical protein
MKTKNVKLKNRYTKDIVFSEKYNEPLIENGVNFILVYSEANPHRKFLVNRDAYEIVVK